MDRPTRKKTLKKEGRDAEGRMGGGDDEQDKEDGCCGCGAVCQGGACTEP